MAELRKIIQNDQIIDDLDNSYSALFSLVESFSTFEEWDFKESDILGQLADSISTTHLFGGIHNFNDNGNVF